MERKESLIGIKIQTVDGGADTLQRSIVSSPVHTFPGELSSQSPAHSSSATVRQSTASASLRLSFFQSYSSFQKSSVCNHNTLIVCYFRGDLTLQTEPQILLHCVVNEEERALIPHRIIGKAATNFCCVWADSKFSLSL